MHHQHGGHCKHESSEEDRTCLGSPLHGPLVMGKKNEPGLPVGPVSQAESHTGKEVPLEEGSLLIGVCEPHTPPQDPGIF